MKLKRQGSREAGEQRGIKIFFSPASLLPGSSAVSSNSKLPRTIKPSNNIQSWKIRGFTLIELLIAVTILVIISGVAYSAFKSALSLYKREDQKLTMVQKSRVALERLLLDLNNAYMSPNDQELSFVAADLSDQNLDTDTLTFVTISDPTLRSNLTLTQTGNMANLGNNNQTQEQLKPEPDLTRVAYYIGLDPKGRISNQKMNQPRLSLIRATSANLNLDEVSDLLFGFQNTNPNITNQEQLSEQVKIGVVVDDIIALNFRYYNGEDWLETWDDQNRLPQAVEVTLTVKDEEDKGKSYTQASIAHLTLSQ